MKILVISTMLEYTLDKNVAMFCEDLVNFAERKPLKYGVDRKKGY